MADNVDMPIYVQVIDKPFSMYVIEEKRGTLQKEASSKWGEDKISVVVESKRDRIKGIPPPGKEFDLGERLVAVDSKLYRIGSDLGPMVMDLGVEDEDKLEWVSIWKDSGFIEAVAGEDGCMYALNYDRTLHRIRDDDDQYPSIEAVFMDNSWKQLIGVTKNRIYMRTRDHMTCYDLQSGGFDIVGNPTAAIGVEAYIPYDERYLCAYKYEKERLEGEDYINEYVNKYVPGIYVYDTKQRRWLPGPVQGLPTDGEILPRPKITCLDLGELTFSTTYLLQIGTHEGSPKLALVHQSLDESGCQLYWCKFVLHVQEDADSSHPSFRAHILSNGIYHLGKGTASLIDCTAAVR